MGSSIIFVILVLLPHVCRTTWFHTISPFRVLEGSVVRCGLTVQATKEQFSNWAAFEFTSLQNKAAEIIRGGWEAPIVRLVAQKTTCNFCMMMLWMQRRSTESLRMPCRKFSDQTVCNNVENRATPASVPLWLREAKLYQKLLQNVSFFYYYLLTSQDISLQSLKNVGRYLEQYCNINEHIKMTVSNMQKGRNTVQEGDRKSVRRASGWKK